MEIIVRNGKWFDVNNGYPAFTKLRKNDIVFNHKQTEELFKNGYVTGSHARIVGANNNGTAHHNGTALYSGTAFASGSASKTTFDWIERYLEKFQDAVDKFAVSAESIHKSWSARKTATASEIKNQKSLVAADTKAASKYQSKAKSALKSAGSSAYKKYWGKITSGSLSTSEIDTSKKTGKALQKAIDFYDKYKDATQAAVEDQDKLFDMYVDLFELTESKFEAQLQSLETALDLIDAQIDTAEATGRVNLGSYYTSKRTNLKSTNKTLQQEYDALVSDRKTYLAQKGSSKNSEEYAEMTNAIAELKVEIEKNNSEIAECTSEIRQIKWDAFDSFVDRLDDLTEESDLYIDILSRQKMYDKDGKITSAGMATQGLHAQNYNTYMQQSAEIASQIKALDKEIAKDPLNNDLIERRQELIESQRDAIESAYDEADAISDLISDGYESQLDKMDDVIDKYSDMLDAEQDLYDYQKKVKDQTKEIADLEKRRSVLFGDDSEEARQQLQKIELDLEDARSELQETQMDQYFSDQKKLLNDLQDEYENTVNEVVDSLKENITENISSAIDATNNNRDTISATINELAEKNGINLSTSMDTIWNSDSGRAVSSYVNGSATAWSHTNAAVDSIKNDVKNLYGLIASNSGNSSTGSSNGSSSSSGNSSSSGSSSSSALSHTAKSIASSLAKNVSGAIAKKTSSSSGDGKIKIGDKVTFASGKYHSTTSGGSTGNKYLGKKVYITKTSSSGKYKYYISTGKKLGSGDLGWVSKDQIKGYAAGGFISDMQKVAYQNGDDMVTINTLKPGEAVLSPEQTKQFVKLTNFLPEASKMIDTISYAYNSPNVSSSQPTGNVNISSPISLTLNLPNVKNYSEFMQTMQKDPNAAKMIQAMAIGEAIGQGKFSKYKAKF